MNFQSFNLHPLVEAGVRAAGYEQPTSIQERAVPRILEGNDLVGLAQTGTGKTAAYVLPTLHRLMSGRGKHVRALIIAPTRELVEQIHMDISRLGQKTGLRSVTIYGGVAINPQIDRLRKKPRIVAACPGRLLDHLNRGTIDLSRIETLVLDEADHMFDMGFFPDIRRILSTLPTERQTLLFSATMPRVIREMARDILKNPVTVQIGATAPAKSVKHTFYPVAHDAKTSLLINLLLNTRTRSVLVFTRTKHRAKNLESKLKKAGYSAASLQGNLSQSKRQAALEGFRTGKYQILVATDIAARGLDVSRVSHVINYDMPDTPEAYIHRIGRTGRAARQGDAFTLITPQDLNSARAIERVLGAKIERCAPPLPNDRPPVPAIPAITAGKRPGHNRFSKRY
jgi:ATP-dependent RNA helicase RhlE